MKNLYFNQFRFSKRKIFIVFVFLLFAFVGTFDFNIYASADDNQMSDIEESINNSINDIIESVDLSELQNIINDVDDIGFMNNDTLQTKLESILSGEYFTDYSSIAKDMGGYNLHDILGF